MYAHESPIMPIMFTLVFFGAMLLTLFRFA